MLSKFEFSPRFLFFSFFLFLGTKVNCLIKVQVSTTTCELSRSIYLLSSFCKWLWYLRLNNGLELSPMVQANDKAYNSDPALFNNIHPKLTITVELRNNNY